MTKKENFAVIRTIIENTAVENQDELLTFIDHEVELLSRKRSTSSKPTKRQVENTALKERISEILLRAESGMTAGDITKAIASDDATPNRVVALLTQMKKDGMVVREEVKGKAMFSIA